MSERSFRERYAEDDNEWWRESSGALQNEYDALLEENERLVARQQESEGVVVEIVEGTSRHIPHDDPDKFYYIIESPELLSLEKVRLTRIEGEE